MDGCSFELLILSFEILYFLYHLAYGLICMVSLPILPYLFHHINHRRIGHADNVQVENVLYLTDSSSILELSPGRTGNVDISFEVPTNAQSIEMDYNFNPFKDDVGVFIGQ